METTRHPDEEQRLATLQACGIMDTPREDRYDRLVFQAAQVCRTPIAAISFLDRLRCWRKSLVGDSNRELSREDAFCSLAILQDDLFKIEDARIDSRYSHNVYVADAPFIRFFAAQSICADDGMPIGTISVIDRQPRVLTELQEHALQGLAQEARSFLRPVRAV